MSVPHLRCTLFIKQQYKNSPGQPFLQRWCSFRHHITGVPWSLPEINVLPRALCRDTFYQYVYFGPDPTLTRRSDPLFYPPYSRTAFFPLHLHLEPIFYPQAQVADTAFSDEVGNICIIYSVLQCPLYFSPSPFFIGLFVHITACSSCLLFLFSYCTIFLFKLLIIYLCTFAA